MVIVSVEFADSGASDNQRMMYKIAKLAGYALKPNGPHLLPVCMDLLVRPALWLFGLERANMSHSGSEPKRSRRSCGRKVKVQACPKSQRLSSDYSPTSFQAQRHATSFVVAPTPRRHDWLTKE